MAPKSRQQARSTSAKDSRSVTSRHSAGGRSAKSGTRPRSSHHEKETAPLFLRGIARSIRNQQLFDDALDEVKDEGLRVWLDPEHLYSKPLRGTTCASVCVVKPAGLLEPADPQSQPSPDQIPAQKVIAKLHPWPDAPDSHHAALSSLLCAALGAEGLCGGLVRVEPAPTPLPKTASVLKDSTNQQASKDAITKRLRITPYIATGKTNRKDEGFKFGGESKASLEESAQQIRSIFGKAILEGPLTDGMFLPALDSWPGGVLDFDPPPPGDPSKSRLNWLLGADRKLEISVHPEQARPKLPKPLGEPLPDGSPVLVAIEKVAEQTESSLLHGSSVLLTGGLGSGKSSLASLLAHQLRNEQLFSTIYLPCRSLVSEETRVKTIKETLQRAFATAAWNARMNGRALVILDDLDRLCPVETELQTQDNGRSRQVSELLTSIVRQWCTRESGVVMLATVQSKEALHNVVIGGHVVRDIIGLKAPSKDGRRQVLELLVRQKDYSNGYGDAPVATANRAINEWMEGSEASRPSTADGPIDDGVGHNLDLLDIAGQTDGYMPGDLALLVSRARSEALIRAVSEASMSDNVTLSDADFTAALKGFTPASLRGVTLQSSTTTFASIGGLRQTRQTLLETLQYPTTYAPLFAKCPLRLRSGLLLYGYPGCGKTLLASAVAGECGLNFISVKGPEILNKYIGASEKSVRDLFERAEAAKPCVLFFDEFDSIAPKRGHDSTGVTDRVVNMLLTMMDGAEGLSGVYVLAATSRPDLIDPALLRPGRLDKSLICDMPDQEDRLDILKAIASKLKIEPVILSGRHGHSLWEVARRTEGYSGADLQAVVYNAHLEAIQDVLGNANGVDQDFGKKKGDDRKGSSRQQDFAYFKMGGHDHQSNGVSTPASVATERAQIASKLAALQSARKKAREARHVNQGRPPSAGMQVNGDKEDRSQEPIVQWQHLEKSLGTTRSSISAQEQRRLAKIYREFVVGRSGDMHDGQGGTEIGGRSSLM